MMTVRELSGIGMLGYPEAYVRLVRNGSMDELPVHGIRVSRDHCVYIEPGGDGAMTACDLAALLDALPGDMAILSPVDNEVISDVFHHTVNGEPLLLLCTPKGSRELYRRHSDDIRDRWVDC